MLASKACSVDSDTLRVAASVVMVLGDRVKII